MTTTRQELENLLSAVAKGDVAAFNELYQETSSKLFAVALRILRNRDSAEEVVQECYFKIWEKADGFEPQISSPMTWMAAIVRNRALDEVRRRPTRPFADVSELENIESDDELPIAALERREDVEKLRRCLECLEPEKRQIVQLAYLHGMSREALAKRFDRPEGTIKSWLRRSLAQLKGCLER